MADSAKSLSLEQEQELDQVFARAREALAIIETYDQARVDRLIQGGDLVTGTFYQYLGGAFVMALAALAFETGKITITGELIFALAWLVFVLSIGAIFLLMIMIRDGELSKVASHFYLVPAVTALIAWALFGEELMPVQIVGMAIAAFGVALATGRSPGAPAPRVSESL